MGDGQTENEGIPSQGGRGDALLRRVPIPDLTLPYILGLLYEVFVHQVTGSLSDGLGTITFDQNHQETRDEIRSQHSGTGTDHLIAGMKGLGYGMIGGLLSIPRSTIQGYNKSGMEVCYLITILIEIFNEKRFLKIAKRI